MDRDLLVWKFRRREIGTFKFVRYIEVLTGIRYIGVLLHQVFFIWDVNNFGPEHYHHHHHHHQQTSADHLRMCATGREQIILSDSNTIAAPLAIY